MSRNISRVSIYYINIYKFFDMANVNFKRGKYNDSAINQLKNGDIFFDTTPGLNNNGIYISIPGADGKDTAVKVAMGASDALTTAEVESIWNEN